MFDSASRGYSPRTSGSGTGQGNSPLQHEQRVQRHATARLQRQLSACLPARWNTKLVWVLLSLSYVGVYCVVSMLINSRARPAQELMLATRWSDAAVFAPDGTAASSRVGAAEVTGAGSSSSARVDGRRGHIPRSSVLDAIVAAPTAPSRTLQFKVCNGFTNQRLSLLYGVLLAVKTGRNPVIPCLLSNGIQLSTATVSAGAGNTPCKAFSSFYDEQFFVRQMRQAGVHVLTQAEAEVPTMEVVSESLRSRGSSILQVLNSTANNMMHVSMDCALWALDASELDSADEHLMWHILSALRPASHLQSHINQVSRLMREHGVHFNFLHLRIERDWVQHCQRWSAIPDGQVRDNCYNNTDRIAATLESFGLHKEVPLYVASDWKEVDSKAQPLQQLTRAGYHLLSALNVGNRIFAGLAREERALVEYYIAFNADRFIGNSVSTFSSLLMLERRHHGQWAAYYNGGNVPLAVLLPPLMKMPWVFTYNSWSAEYEYMLKAAVRSGVVTAGLKAYCIFMGNKSSSIHSWLQETGVTMIYHQPAWRDRLLQIIDAQADKIAENKEKHSHLFATPDMMVGTFQRIDIPLVPVLDQYSYVLFTDCDVYFRRPITLDSFGLPLPKTITMSYEGVNMFPYNAGVFLANLPALRLHHEDLIATMLEGAKDGLQFPGYGPMDQGLLNIFFEKDLKANMLSQDFNAKPYLDLRADAFIVHFHGPKPHDYLDFMRLNQCRFKDMCRNGFERSLCPYVQEWAAHSLDSFMAAKLDAACELLTNPIMKSLFAEKWGLRKRSRYFPWW